ncbi:MAG: ATP-binding cassette domain-containing protein [Bacteroidota bacterium]
MAEVEIRIQQLAKRFQKEWIFGGIDQTLLSGQKYAVKGPNGSGKSTFLQLIAGLQLPTRGQIHYRIADQEIKAERVYKYLSLCAPYLELIEEFSLEEIIRFHLHFKPFRPQVSQEAFIQRMGLEKARKKPLQFFSSGMKQRIKLGLALYSDTPILLLDEPTSNLDQNGIDWYREEVLQTSPQRLLIICSNQSYEYDFCEQVIDIQSFKPKRKS